MVSARPIADGCSCGQLVAARSMKRIMAATTLGKSPCTSGCTVLYVCEDLRCPPTVMSTLRRSPVSQ